MKKFIFFLTLFSVSVLVNADVVSWKGKEMGIECSPDWLVSYLEKKDENPMRKKFDIEYNEIIFHSVAADLVLENARYTAELNCIKEMVDYRRKLNASKNKVQKVSGMEALTEYWELDNTGTYTIHVFYTMRKKS